MTEVVDWLGASGRTYRDYVLASINPSSIKDEGGNYVFAKKLLNGNYEPLYFGVASSLRTRIPSHELLPDAKRLGVTHVMGHTTPAGEAARLSGERDLIQYWNPVLNTQHRTIGWRQCSGFVDLRPHQQTETERPPSWLGCGRFQFLSGACSWQ